MVAILKKITKFEKREFKKWTNQRKTVQFSATVTGFY